MCINFECKTKKQKKNAMEAAAHKSPTRKCMLHSASVFFFPPSPSLLAASADDDDPVPGFVNTPPTSRPHPRTPPHSRPGSRPGSGVLMSVSSYRKLFYLYR